MAAVSNDELPARIVLMGGGRVGTTSLIRRFSMGMYVDTYRPEQAKVMRHTKYVYLQRLRDHVIVQFWDCEGEDIRTSLMCAQKAHAVAVVYDITNRASFEFAQKLLDHINPRATAVLIANKLDQEENRKVSTKEGKILAKIHRVEYIETTAREDRNVQEAFQILVSSVPDDYLLLKNGRMAGQYSPSTKICSCCHKNLNCTNKDDVRRKERYNSH
ncbi:hypothetical protein CAPTEDRAFT_186447 [Capitella teleta]|uniref:small monomeric GTPase n=1 Tax=Capitella teleta TaxID=283909 RepID=R7U7T4_CAPTE|nr:hypothetical protein CAPTEDRAFT_186447 [Capitella teleta]|eukprot:ELU02024.1 hypothetical protein CAPTEDRAFT_186447 [Capitella teleta]